MAICLGVPAEATIAHLCVLRTLTQAFKDYLPLLKEDYATKVQRIERGIVGTFHFYPNTLDVDAAGDVVLTAEEDFNCKWDLECKEQHVDAERRRGRDPSDEDIVHARKSKYMFFLAQYYMKLVAYFTHAA